MINRIEVAKTGERHLIRDIGLLESAAARAQNRWAYEQEDDIAILAAALTAGLVWNHPFEQGNKRTGFTAGLVFAELNGYRFTMEDTKEPGRWIEALVLRAITERDYAELIAVRFVPLL